MIGAVTDKDYISENGDVIEAIFSRKSIYDRIVNSADQIGTTSTLLKVIAKQAVAMYRKE